MAGPSDSTPERNKAIRDILHRGAPAPDSVTLRLDHLRTRLTRDIWFSGMEDETAKVDIEQLPVGDFMTATQAAKFIDRIEEVSTSLVFDGKAYDYKNNTPSAITIFHLEETGPQRLQVRMREGDTGQMATVAITDVEIPPGISDRQAEAFFENIFKAAKRKLLSGQVLT